MSFAGTFKKITIPSALSPKMLTKKVTQNVQTDDETESENSEKKEKEVVV